MRIQTIIFYAVCLALWIACANAFAFEKSFLPDPALIFTSLVSLISNGDFFVHLFSTISRLVFGLVISALIGLPIGMMIGFNEKFRLFVLPALDFFRSIPTSMLFPAYIALFGLGEFSKGMIVCSFAAPIFAISIMVGLQPSRQQQAHFDYLTIHRREMPTWLYVGARLWKALPSLLTGIRLSLSLGLVLVIVTEMFFVADSGIGWAAYRAYESFKISEMYAYICVSGLIGFTMNTYFDSVTINLQMK